MIDADDEVSRRRADYMRWQNESFKAQLKLGNRKARRAAKHKLNACRRCGILIRPPSEADHSCEDCGKRI